MSKKFVFFMVAISFVIVVACSSNKQLNRDNAVKAIHQAIAAHTPIPYGNVEACFNVPSIASIEPVSQFSDREATTVVAFKCGFSIKYVFQKDVENRWFLTKLDWVPGAPGNTQIVDEIVVHNQNLKVLAQ